MHQLTSYALIFFFTSFEGFFIYAGVFIPDTEGFYMYTEVFHQKSCVFVLFFSFLLIWGLPPPLFFLFFFSPYAFKFISQVLRVSSYVLKCLPHTWGYLFQALRVTPQQMKFSSQVPRGLIGFHSSCWGFHPKYWGFRPRYWGFYPSYSRSPGTSEKFHRKWRLTYWKFCSFPLVCLVFLEICARTDFVHFREFCVFMTWVQIN